MITPRRAGPSLNSITVRFGPAGVRIAVVLVLLCGALKLDDRVRELEHRERTLQARIEAVVLREVRSSERERALRAEVDRLESIRLAAQKVPASEPRPLTDDVVIRASRQPGTLPSLSH